LKTIGDFFLYLLKTKDGMCTIFWSTVYLCYFFYQFFISNFQLDTIKFLSYIILLLLTFIRFRINDFEIKTNYWVLFNINIFNFIFIYLEFKK
jgi:hypothetical protein